MKNFYLSLNDFWENDWGWADWVRFAVLLLQHFFTKQRPFRANQRHADNVAHLGETGFSSSFFALFREGNITKNLNNYKRLLTDAGGGDKTEVGQRLRVMRSSVGELQSELRQLRRAAQVNAHSSRQLLRDTFDRINAIVNAAPNVSGMAGNLNFCLSFGSRAELFQSTMYL